MSLSVILPVYNAEAYLKAAMESVLNQTVREFELVVLNDGSSDKSQEILESIAESDSRVRLISQENAGLIQALNRLIQESRGDILFRMDADDIAEPDRFEKQMAYLDDHPECVALGMAVQLIDSQGRPLRVMRPPLDHDGIDGMGIRGIGAAIHHPTAAIRREAIEAIGGYRDEYPHAEDVDLFLRLAEVGDLANLSDVGLQYRIHFGSVGYTHRSRQADSARRAAADACIRRGLALTCWDETDLSDRDLYQSLVMWAWWALGDGNVATARYYAMKAMMKSPCRFRSWKLLACAMRGH